MGIFVEIMAFLIIVGFWMFIGLLCCAILLKVFAMAMGITGMELYQMLADHWVSRINRWGGNHGKN